METVDKVLCANTDDLDAAVYPDSGKIGIWGKGTNQVYRPEDEAEYFNGE